MGVSVCDRIERRHVDGIVVPTKIVIDLLSGRWSPYDDAFFEEKLSDLALFSNTVRLCIVDISRI
jgi:hypothetical protein